MGGGGQEKTEYEMKKVSKGKNNKGKEREGQ